MTLLWAATQSGGVPGRMVWCLYKASYAPNVLTVQLPMRVSA